MGLNEEQSGNLRAPGGARDFDGRYLAFFTVFNQGRHFEAHDVLEELWLEVRRQPIGDFYKSLIQLAGAFVHVRRGRFQPALALLDLACRRIGPYPDRYEGFDLAALRRSVARWRRQVELGAGVGWLDGEDRPRLELQV